jgi:hypothetical protein
MMGHIPVGPRARADTAAAAWSGMSLAERTS